MYVGVWSGPGTSSRVSSTAGTRQDMQGLKGVAGTVGWRHRGRLCWGSWDSGSSQAWDPTPISAKLNPGIPKRSSRVRPKPESAQHRNRKSSLGARAPGGSSQAHRDGAAPCHRAQTLRLGTHPGPGQCPDGHSPAQSGLRPLVVLGHSGHLFWQRRVSRGAPQTVIHTLRTRSVPRDTRSTQTRAASPTSPGHCPSQQAAASGLGPLCRPPGAPIPPRPCQNLLSAPLTLTCSHTPTPHLTPGTP